MTKRKIGFASTDWSRSIVGPEGPIPGGANWVRLQQNRPHLGYESVTGLLIHHPAKGFGILDWFNQSHYNCDVIVLQRLMFRDLVEKIELRSKYGQVLINDLDDWYWGLHEDNHAYALTHPDHNKDENIEYYKEIIKRCDGVTVSTPFLYEKMSQDFGCKKVDIIENCVTVSDFRQRSVSMKKPIVGWVGSTSHRSGDLELLSDVLANKKWRLHHSGHINSAAWFADKVGVARDKVTKAPMYPPREYAKNSFCFDIGIAPLNDIPFNWAKSWIKGIEYAAAGIPFVATNISEYKRLHDEYGIGRLASTNEEWVEHLTELCEIGVRSKESKNIKTVVQENLNVHNMAARWRQVLDSYT